MNKLTELLNALESNIMFTEKKNPAVSESSVGWHIEHSLLTINLIIESLQKSNPANYKWKFNFTKMLVYTMNKIPRGRAKSPASVRPSLDFTAQTLQQHLAITRARIEELKNLQPNQYFEHPFFGK
ncbi:MAG: hypothetical protein H7X88_07410, partial [Gloeobacteraceae cyanobacterium ES-bin-316]|nr:hypothetical protein [Ferruginibacter sp.]